MGKFSHQTTRAKNIPKTRATAVRKNPYSHQHCHLLPFVLCPLPNLKKKTTPHEKTHDNAITIEHNFFELKHELLFEFVYFSSAQA